MQNIDGMFIQGEVTDFRDQLSNHVSSTNPGASVRELVGTKEVIPRTDETLSMSLPYQHVVTTDQMAELPSQLRHKFRFVLENEFGSELLRFERPTAQIAGQRLALSFQPSTAADEETVASYLPEQNADGEIDPEQLPDSLPGYLINVSPQWTVNGQVQASSDSAIAMGTELTRVNGVYSPTGGWQLREKVLTAGEYHAIGLDLQGVSLNQIEELQARVDATADRLVGDVTGSVDKH